MKDYISHQLLGDEHVEYQAKAHWVVYIKGIILFAIGSVLLATEGRGLALIFLILGVLALVWAYLWQRTTELAITNKRVVAKFGIIRRHTIDQQLSKIEGTNLEQGILGRMLGYASIVVRGTGSGRTPIPYIGNPDEFKRELGSRLT